jgi:hypothetical protein
VLLQLFHSGHLELLNVMESLKWYSLNPYTIRHDLIISHKIEFYTLNHTVFNIFLKLVLLELDSDENEKLHVL